MGGDVSILFDPVRIGTLELPNRIVMAPMTRNFAQDGVLMPTGIEYYRRRAAGGVGLILTEGVATSRIGAHTAAVPHFLTKEARAPWRGVVAAVHGEGGRIMAQLWHTGLGRIRDQGFDPEVPSIGPGESFIDTSSPLFTDTPADGNPRLGRTMGGDDIRATIAEFADAAATAQDLGFDGIQLHGAHGYLLDQFFWAESNRRTDDYGGDIAARSRLAAEVVAAIRGRTGTDFTIGLRFSQWKLPDHYQIRPLANPQELAAMLAPLVAAGVDFLDASTRRYWEPAFEGSDLNLSGWAKQVTGLPVMTVGSVGLTLPLDPTMVEDKAEPEADLAPLIGMVERGEVDLVGVGRALIANADWPQIIRTPDAKGRPFEMALLMQHD